ncbi:hypothetical protein ACHAXT_011334 [Thalassiosira profunda]
MAPPATDSSDDAASLSSSKLGSDPPEDGGALESSGGSDGEAVSEESGSGSENEGDDDDEEEEDECFVCKDGGELILCDAEGCSKAYHADCIGVDINTLPLTWLCPGCTAGEAATASVGEPTAWGAGETAAESHARERARLAAAEGAWEERMAAARDKNRSRPERGGVDDAATSVTTGTGVTTATAETRRTSNVSGKGGGGVATKGAVEGDSGGMEGGTDSTDNGAPANASVPNSEEAKGNVGAATGGADNVEPSAANTDPATNAEEEATTKIGDPAASATSSGAPQSQPPSAEFRKMATKKCAVAGCPNHLKRCLAHGKLVKTCKVSGCNNFPQGGRGTQPGMCIRHGGGTRCKTEGCNKLVVPRGHGFCREHLPGEGAAAAASKQTPAAKKAKSASTSPPPPSEAVFRTVTVPEGVAPGDAFRVLLGPGRVMGAICPGGVKAGDTLVVLEPGKLEPPVAPREIARRNAARLLEGLDQSDATLVSDAFWKALWPALREKGWAVKRQTQYNFGATTFYPPGRPVEASERVANVHYFETLRSVLDALAKEPEGYGKIVQEFEEAVAAAKKARDEKKKRKRAAESDAWKYVGERKAVPLGRRYQADSLPRAGTHTPGEGDAYISERIADPAALATDMTPAAWRAWADDPALPAHFHELLIRSKKQLRALATRIDRPVAFCLWFYYHRYKTQANDDNYRSLKRLMSDLKEREDNSDVCAVCDEGGNLICCETCPDSYHVTCLGLNPTDVEGIEHWSCPNCHRKRMLQLSPPKSPRKRLRGEGTSPGDEGEKNTAAPSAANGGGESSNSDLSQTIDGC